MALNTLNQTTLVENYASGVQALSTDLIDFSVGSISRAEAEADAGQALWLQALVVQLLLVTRAMSCTGVDLDTWCVQFMPAIAGTVSTTLPYGTPRLQAVASTGQVTISRYTAATTAPFIPVGTLLKTADGSQSFTVYADATNAAYSATLGGFTMPSGSTSLTLMVQAVNAGTQGNVSAGTITQIASQVTGVSTVTNAAAFTNGIDFEQDSALFYRFQLWIQSLSKATQAAITLACLSIQPNMQVAFHNNIDPSGATDYGMITVYVDDGSGNPPAATVTAALNAAAMVQAGGTRLGVYGASTLTANYAMTLTSATGYVHSAVVTNVTAAINAYINGLGIENALRYAALDGIAWTVAGVTNVTGVTLNGGTSDLVPSFGQSIKSGLAVVS